MKIAFDVKGTIEGSKKKQVLRMIELFHKAGHDIIVWSNSYGYAVDAVKDNNLDFARAESKSDKWNTSEENFYDLAVEDDRQQGQWLAAKQFIFVDDIPEEMASVDELVRELLPKPTGMTLAAIKVLDDLLALPDDELQKKFDEFGEAWQKKLNAMNGKE